MNSTALILILFIAIVAVLAMLTAWRPELTRERGGKVLAFVALCILPVLAVWAGATEHLQRSTSTQFCLSCHVMADFGNLRDTVIEQLDGCGIAEVKFTVNHGLMKLSVEVIGTAM